MRFQQIANSSPGAQIAPGVINAQGELVLDANIYKTKMCEHHALGRCLFGRACQNAHHPLELRAPPSTPLPKPYVPPGTCKFFYLANFCPFNDGCRSKHVTFASEAQAALMCVAVPMAPPPPPPKKKNIWQEPKPLHRTELPWRKPLKMPPIDLGVTPSKPSAASSSPPSAARPTAVASTDVEPSAIEIDFAKADLDTQELIAGLAASHKTLYMMLDEH